MIETARPGLPAAELYAAVMERMLELGSAYYPLALFASPLGTRGPRFENPPPDLVLHEGDLITHETAAVWGGLIAQELQPILLGAIPEAWKPVVDMQREVFHAGLYEAGHPSGRADRLREWFRRQARHAIAHPHARPRLRQ